MPLRILCTADLHLGRSSALIEGARVDDPTTAGAWTRIVNLALSERVDAVAIAGDIFEDAAAQLAHRTAFLRGLQVLDAEHVPVVAVAGNHDWDALPAFKRAYPDANLTLVGLGGWEQVAITSRSGQFTAVGRSFDGPTAPNPFAEFRPVRTGTTPVLGLVHCDIGVGSRYGSITVTDIPQGHADAWLFGHLHGRKDLRRDAIWPGSPQAMDFGPGERGVHGACILTLDGNRSAFSDTRPLSTVVYACEDCDIDTQGDLATSLDEGASRCSERLRATHFADALIQLRLACAVRATGPVNGFESDAVLTGANRAARYAWECVALTRLPEVPLAAYAEMADAPGQAARLVLALDGDARWQSNLMDVLAACDAEIRKLARHRPWTEARDDAGPDDHSRDYELRRLLRTALLSQIRASEESRATAV